MELGYHETERSEMTASTTTPGAFVRADHDGEHRWFFGGGVHTWKVRESQTNGAFLLFEDRMTQGKLTPLHIHPDCAEAFYVLEGEYLMYVGERQQRCPPGTFVYVPRDTPHTFKVISPGPGRKLVLFSPAAMLGYFEELCAAQAAGEPTVELLEAIGRRNNVEVVGPVPDTYL